MPGTTKERNRKKLHNREEDERTLQSLKQGLKPCNKGHSSLPIQQITKFSNNGNGNNVNSKRKKIVDRAIKTKTYKKKSSSSGLKPEPSIVSTKENEKTDDRDVKSRRRNKRKNNVELDEASRIQRRTRYLLVKIKLEQNLIDAYSTEGWKGQSREKIRPEKELQRAKKQILSYKLSIREALHQLDVLSSEGRINDSKVASDGSVHHKHIVCAKCIILEALPDNDIILCDGTCNRAFHQKCLDPPLLTENIPPGDEGWFCKFCKKKMEIIEATNAHIGTHFPLDCKWQDVFEEEANLPDDVNSMLRVEEEWPSDDSEDNDYNPDRIERSGSDCMSRSESDASDHSSSFLGSLEDETGIAEERRNRSFDNDSHDLVGVDSEDCEVVYRPRQRAAVDYIKLYHEMFGKNGIEHEQISDDDDWGPGKKKRKVKETDAASTLMTLGETEKKIPEKMPSDMKEKESSDKSKRQIFRFPHNAVEKLRLVFAENELPERALRVSLSKQLGLEFEKVNKWFKNARYLALKSRKQVENTQEDVSPGTQNEPTSESETADHPDRMMSSDSHKNLKKIVSMTTDPVDDMSLRHLKEKAKESKKSKCKSIDVSVLEAETEMERLCEIKSRVEKLQQVLLQLPSRGRFGKSKKPSDSSVIYVPVAELKEKR
ncbi:hypothetical protein CASFOL_012105 [Castilleja foliolosa]|uniref:Pathogenesis-related homeodomain protein n=1 Tax=Castilleja foliolosa TaxID=1961234 RepID=A0ABD3DPF1_9LAMI